MEFEWDEAKDWTNQRKHGVSFDDAIEVFVDPLCILLLDRVVDGEQRWHALGEVSGQVLLTVTHTSREKWSDEKVVEIVRVISARPASRTERRLYDDENG